MEEASQAETFCQRVVAAATLRPNRVAMMLIEAEGKETITFGSMLAQVRSIAYRLTQEKIAFGDRVALIGENRPNWAIAYLGTQSYLDPFLVCSTYPRRVLSDIFHVGASIYFTNAAMAQFARLINVVPIDPDVQLLRAMRAGAAGLRATKILNIYPEGQRSFDGQLHEFKKGAAILATELNVPIVPVALDGTYRIWPRKSWRFRLAKVKITFGAPIYPSEVTHPDLAEEVVYERLIALVKDRIQRLLDEMREIRK
jgi:1-acyl-sn-glycerol-3-phosphate acyltransferase